MFRPNPLLCRVVALALSALFVSASGADAHSIKHKRIEVVHPWCFAAQKDAASVAIYMVVRNGAKQPDRLVRASAKDGGKIELREAGQGGTDHGVSAIALPPGKEVVFKRGGRYLSLTGFGQELQPNDSFLVTLEFAHAGKMEVDVTVAEKDEGASH